MKREINVRMTAERAAALEAPIRAGYTWAMRPMQLDTEAMTPAAAWIAQHIDATYINDELLHHIGIRAVSGQSMAERDRQAGRSEDYIARMTEGYGETYAAEPMTVMITFPVYGRRHQRPEDVIEETVAELRKAGAAKLIADNGDTIEL